MAYGDNRSQVAYDDFEAGSINANWDNGIADWDTCVQTAGELRPSATVTDCAMIRNGETFDDDQYSRAEVANHVDTGDNWLAVNVRMQDSATDESCYQGNATTNGDLWRIYEVSSAFGFTSLGDSSSVGDTPLAAGETITLEAEGTTLRLGGMHGGNADQQEFTTTDNTITSGYPGLSFYEASAVTNCAFESWEGGNINTHPFSHKGDATNDGNSTSASVTHGLTINQGDLIVAYVNSNSATVIFADAGGATWNEVVDETPSAESAQHALYWKIAGASEPSSWSWTVGNAEWRVCVKVFSNSGPDAVVDQVANAVRSSGTYASIAIEASNGETPAAKSVSVVFGGKDNRGDTIAYTVVDNFYEGVIGDDSSQAAAGAHKFFESAPGSLNTVNIEDASGDDGITDNVYGAHISFVEGAGVQSARILRRRMAGFY